MNTNTTYLKINSMSGRLLTAEQVAEILSVSRSFAYRMMQSGEIATVHLGRSVRVRPEDLERFIKDNLSGNGI